MDQQMNNIMVAEKQALTENATDAAYALQAAGLSRRETFAIMVAALAREGWTGRPSEKLLGSAMDGWEPDELAAARRAAMDVSQPWAAWEDATVDGSEAADVLRRVLRATNPGADEEPTATRFDLDADAPPAPWLIPGFVVRGSTTEHSAAVHAFKTGFWNAAMVASLRGVPFLGREIEPLRWLRVDAENPQRRIQTDWKALGFENADWAAVRLFDREQRIRLVEPEQQDWLRRQVEDHAPDVIVLDTVARIWSGLDVNSPQAVVEVYEFLQALCDEYALAVILTHHHRKSGGKGDEAASGTVQWTGQADQTMTTTNTAKIKLTPSGDGTASTLSKFSAQAFKMRDLAVNAPVHFEVRGMLDAKGTTTDMAVTLPETEPTPGERLLAALHAPLGRGALADAVDMNSTGTAFRKALDEKLETGEIVKTEDNLYERRES